MSSTPSNLEDQARFGARLRMQREARALSISDVVKVTKIPERSLLLLESGGFKDLPAEVFVRGFLKSYCRCVGLDVDQILREHAELVAAAEPVRREPPTLTRPSSRDDQAAAEGPRRTTGPHAAVGERSAATAEGPTGEPPPPAAEEKEEPSVFDALARAGRSTSRASLTVAVIILVIVATLTLSLLLRRPGHVGNGVSSRAPAGSPGVAPTLRAG